MNEATKVPVFTMDDGAPVQAGSAASIDPRTMDKVRDDVCIVKNALELSVPLMKDGVEINKEIVELQRELLACGQSNGADMKKFMNHNLAMTERLEASTNELTAAIRENTAAILNGR